MSNSPLDQIIAFNERLGLVAATGLPIDLEEDGAGQTVEETTSQFAARLGLRVARGESVRQAIDDDTEISPRYRQALISLLTTGETAVALEVASGSAAAERNLKRNVGQWLFQSAIVVVLTLIAFLFTLNYTSPRLEAFYDQMWLEKSRTLEGMITIRHWLPIALPVAAIVCGVGWIAWRRYGNRLRWARIPGGTKHAKMEKQATIAGQLAELLEHGVSTSESLAVCGIAEPVADPLADSGEAAKRISMESLPPLLRWAIGGPHRH
ncbi:MAG: hypothetical protein ACF788_03715, partial [Novipirellula sp. JB048]